MKNTHLQNLMIPLTHSASNTKNFINFTGISVCLKHVWNRIFLVLAVQGLTLPERASCPSRGRSSQLCNPRIDPDYLCLFLWFRRSTSSTVVKQTIYWHVPPHQGRNGHVHILRLSGFHMPDEREHLQLHAPSIPIKLETASNCISTL